MQGPQDMPLGQWHGEFFHPRDEDFVVVRLGRDEDPLVKFLNVSDPAGCVRFTRRYGLLGTDRPIFVKVETAHGWVTRPRLATCVETIIENVRFVRAVLSLQDQRLGDDNLLRVATEDLRKLANRELLPQDPRLRPIESTEASRSSWAKEALRVFEAAFARFCRPVNPLTSVKPTYGNGTLLAYLYLRVGERIRKGKQMYSVCLDCDQWFEPTDRRQRYCNRNCRARANRARNRG